MSETTTRAPSSDEGVIRVLPDVLANKIAAGEVVQRPASVVKELIENALDAGATNIQVIIVNAGRELIQIVDDGCGMSPVDATASFHRHATSKLRSMEDLEGIATLGFRGEALASISAVAQVELRTRRVGDDAGTLVEVAGGKVAEKRPCATPPGTSIAVRNLFFNVPARRNFLKAASTEFKHIVEAFQAQALANPGVAFELIQDGSVVYRLAAAAPEEPFENVLRRRVVDLFGDRQGLVPVGESTSYLTLRGFVGAPDTARKSRGGQFLFVNGRHVKSRSLNHAVFSSYGELLASGVFPFFALFLTLAPGHLDVNVHPEKTEVRFDDERGVYGFIKAVVKRGLATAGLALTVDTSISASVTIPGAGRPVPSLAGGDMGRRGRGSAWTGFRAGGDGGGNPRGPEIMGSETLDPRTFDIVSFPSPPGSGDSGTLRVPSRVEPEQDSSELTDDGPDDRPIWQLHERYLLTPIRFGLMVLDQHAVHVRILYERAMASLDGGMAGTQQLLFPQTVDFNPAEFALLEGLLPELRLLGFDLEPFSGRSVLVRGIPADVHLGSERIILEEVLDLYRENDEHLQLDARENLARSLARKSAIRPGEVLSPVEARTLIDQLFACRMPYADPVGRPTLVKLSMEELAKRFGRTAAG